MLESLEDRVLLAAGDLDTSFGTGGLVDTNVANIQASYYNAKATAVLVEPNGDIVAAGPFDDFAEFGAVRYLPNGTIDTSFGTNGVAIASDGSTIEHANAAALQPDGKIILAGDSFISGEYEFTLVRFNADGSLDTTFGNSGVVTTAVAAGYFSTAYAVTVQPNGAILAVGYSQGAHGSSFALVRYNANGTLDTTFGTGGIVQTQFATNSDDSATAVALEQNDQIVVAGTTNNRVALARYNTNGTLDTTFGTGGLVTGPSGTYSVTGLAIQPNGQIVIAGNVLTSTTLFVSRFNANGTVDSTFGTNGTTVTNGGATIANANALALEPDGKILVTGVIALSSGSEFGTARFTSTGALDPTFGTGGVAVTSFGATFPGGSIDVANAIALQVDGGIVVAGYANGGNSIGIARYLNDLPAPSPLVVTNTNDSGIGSLRWAITNANGMPGTNTITFDIPGPAPYTISPLSLLPAITNPTVIDGTSEPGYAGTPLIQLSGQNAGSGAVGLDLTAGGSTVEGLAINGFTSSGIQISGQGGDLIQGDFIGTDPTGSVALGNGGGGIFVIATTGPALAVTIGGNTAAARNVISGNSFSDGIQIVGASANGTLIEGNYIGTNDTGTVALPNGGGISISNSAVNTTIGGTTAGAGNLISGNEDDGIGLSNAGGSPSGTLIEGNFIGTGVSGTLGLGNGTTGIEINGATDTTIGGTLAAARNVIAGNGTLNPGFDGIFVHGSGATGNLIEGNWIGLTTNGVALSQQQLNGVELNGVGNNTVGGTAAGAGNVISGNAQEGILITGAGASGNLIEGNDIGTDPTGKVAVPNATGVLVEDGPSNTTIGGSATGAGNLISGNTTEGIDLFAEGSVSSGTLIEGNLIGTNATGNASLPNLIGIQVLSAPGTTIGGTSAAARNVISGNTATTVTSSYGIFVEGPSTIGTLIEGNDFGTNSVGTASVPNGSNVAPSGDIALGLGAANTTIGGIAAGAGNLIAAGGYSGIDLQNIGGEPASGTLIEGNRIGTDVTGTKSLGDSADSGIEIDGSAGTTIGGTAVGAGNLIAGLPVNGIVVQFQGSNGILIQGNLLGTDITGTKALGLSTGIAVADGPTGVTIGGTSAGAGNVISGCAEGISSSDTVGGVLVQGNLIGTDITGTNTIPNSFNDVELYGSPNNTIGGTVPGAANVIGGTSGMYVGDGIEMSLVTDSLVEGNFIGTNAAGANLANGGNGIELQSSSGNTIGGTTAGAGNVIAFNGKAGVKIDTASGNGQPYSVNNAVEGNSIYANGALGISLSPSGITLNHVGGPVPGSNNLQNYPVLDSAASSLSGTTIPGTMNGAPNTTYQLEFFASAAEDASGHGEGQTYLGSWPVTTDDTGNVSFTATLPTTVPLGQYIISATATDPNGNTSEFGQDLAVLEADLAVSMTASPNPVAVGADATFVVTVKNNGPNYATATTLSDTLSGAFNIVSVTPSAGGTYTQAGNVITADFGSLPGATTATLTIVVSATASGPLSNAASVSSAVNDLIASNNSTSQTITAESPGTLSFSAATYTASDNSGSETITVNRTGGDLGAVTVQYATSDGTAKAGTDYTATSGTLTFPDGVDSETFTVPILDDQTPDGTESLNLTLSSPTGGATLGTQSTAVLNLTDVPGAFQFSSPTYSVSESAATATITVTRADGDGGAVSVQYATSDGTAKAGTDYTATSGTLNFPDGVDSETFTIPILDNPNPTGDVTVDLALSNAAGGATLGSPATAVLTIDQGAGSLEFSEPAYSVAENGGTATITVTRTYGAAGAVSVNYATSDGSAIAGTDYTATTGSLDFPAGATSETFTIPVLDNPNPDGNTTVNLALTDPTGGAALGSPGTAVLTIDQGVGDLQFSGPTYSVAENGGIATITVARTYGTEGAVSVQYATSDGSATAGTDYTATSGTLDFPDGVDTETFTIPILDNPNPSGNVTVDLTLSDATGGASLGNPTSAVLTIVQGAGSLQFSAPTYSVAENGGTATITVTRAYGTAGAVTVDYATSNGTATAGTDYTATSGTLDFPAAATSETFTIPVLDNFDPAGNTTVNLALTDPTGGAALGSPSTAVLIIDQGAGALQFSAPTYSVAENGGTATITVTRTYGTAGAVSVDYATSDGTAVAGTDYTATSGTLNFPAGVASETITVPILDNPNPSGNVTVDLALTDPAGGATLGTANTAVLTINQGAGEFQFSAPTYSVMDNAVTATITVTRSYGTAGAVTIDYATSDGTAKAGTDYTATSGTLDFADGVSSQTFTIPVLDDTTPDGTVTVNLVLSNPTGGAALGSQATAVLDLTDIPGALQFSAANYDVAENAGTATITVTRTLGDGGPVSVNYATSDGTAKAGTDYAATSGTLNFPDGVATESFPIALLDNPNPSGNVTVNLTLSTPGGGATLGTQSTAVLTIGQGAGTLQFSSPTYSVAENGGTAAITVTRTYGTFGPVSVQYAATSGSAIAGTDFTTVSGTLNFPDGVNSETIDVPILDNPNPSGDVTVNLALSNPTGGATLGTTPSAVLTIDQGPGDFQFSAPAYSVTQNGGSLLVTVTRSYGTAGATSVDYATSDGTAKAGTDYTTTTGTLDFPAGVNSETFSIPILDDPLPNGGDNFNLTLTNPTGGATLGTVTQAVATFQDVPGTLQFSDPTYQVTKDDGAVTVTVTRAVGDGGPVSVDYATTGGSAAPGVEYTPTSGTLNFPDGATTESFNIPIIDDPNPDGTQTVGLVLSNPTGGASLGTPATALLTINDTPGALQFSAATYSAQESDSTATITVTRALGDGGPVAVNYATSDGSAIAGTAYTSTSGTLDFPDGVTTESFTVPILPGGVTAGSEWLQLTLSDPTGGAVLGSQATATLNIATPPGTLQFSDAADSVNANNASIILTVSRTDGSGGSVAVNYATSDGTAIAGTDYTATSGILVLSDGRTSQTLTIPILNNPDRTGNVSFTVTLSDPSGGASLGSVTTDTVTIVDNVVASPPDAPQLTAQSDTGVSDSDGLTRDNGSANAPLVFTVSGVSPPDGFVQLENVNNPAIPVLLGTPVQASGGTATIMLAGAATTLDDGTYQIAATVAASAGGTPSAASAGTMVTVQTALHVTSISPSQSFLTSLPNNQIVVTLNHWLAGLTPDQANGSGFTAAPFAVMLIPSGPDGLATQKQTGVLWSAPSGYDSGDLPLPATAVYHQNADGTSTITLTPHEPLATDIYLITVNGLTDLAGNPLTNAAGQATSVYTSFDYRPDPTTNSALNVASVTTLNGTVAINNNTIPQPDTIGIRFNKPLDQYTVNSSTVQLYGGGNLIPSAVAYSPSTDSAYLTPEATLTPGTVYYVSVGGSVADDGQFPNPGITLGQTYATSFRVNAPGIGAGSGPLKVTGTTPANNTAWSQPFGYGAVTFSEPVNLNALGRFSAMLVPQTGGVTTGTSGYADVPYNAKLAFNPNTRQLIIVPTGYVTNNVVQLFALSGIKAQNGDPLTAAPGQSLPVYASFLLSAPAAQSHVIAASDTTIPVANTAVAPTQPATRDIVRVHPRPAARSAVVPIARRVPTGPLGSERRERGW